MSYITDYRQKFTDLKMHLQNQDQLRRQANGGNSILFSYPPNEEHLRNLIREVNSLKYKRKL